MAGTVVERYQAIGSATAVARWGAVPRKRHTGRRDQSRETMSLISQALADHAVLFVRDQHLTPVQQVELTRRFGAILRVPYISPLAGHPDVVAVLKEADEHNISTFGGTWHSDFSFLDEPPSLTLLYELELPEVGGDTLWSSQYAAYDTLSTGMKRHLIGHATKAEFTCRLRWIPGTLAIWDNRCLLHLAINDYDGSRRLLHRTTVAGQAPLAFINPSRRETVTS